MILDVQIRCATDADVNAITSIYAHHVNTGCATFEIEAPGIAEMKSRMSAIQGSGLPYLVAHLDSLVIGYAYAGLYRVRPAYRFTVEDSIYVHRDYTGHGVGRTLLSKVIARCEARNCRQMVAIIGDSANVASIRLHASFGFRHVGVLHDVGYKFNRWVDSVIMQRPLGPAANAPTAHLEQGN
jgi:L-amino acid N-acyltransferase YncA